MHLFRVRFLFVAARVVSTERKCGLFCRVLLWVSSSKTVSRALVASPGFLYILYGVFPPLRSLSVTFFCVFLLVAVCQADIVFWLGDLNYRIAENVSDAQVFDMLRNDDLETLRYVSA